MKPRRSLLNSNLFVWILSIIIGIAVWLIVNTSTNGTIATTSLTTTSLTLPSVPVVVSTDPNHVVVHVQPSVMSVKVAGSALGVATVQVESTGIRVAAFAKDLGNGVHMVPVTVINMPTTSVTYTPQYREIAVDIEPRATAILTPSVHLIGQVARGYQVGKPVFTQKTVLVTGSRAVVNQVSTVDGQVALSNAFGSLTQTVTWQPRNRQGKVVNGLTCIPATSTVNVPVFQKMKRVALLETPAGQPAKGYAVASVTISPSTVDVSGDNSSLASLTAIGLPSFSVKGWKKTHTVQLPIPVPFQGASLSNPFATVTVQLAPSVETTVHAIPITLVGQKIGVSYAMAPGTTVDVTIAGADPNVYAATQSDFMAYVDVSHLAIGKSRSLPVQITGSSGFTILQKMPMTVTILATKQTG